VFVAAHKIPFVDVTIVLVWRLLSRSWRRARWRVSLYFVRSNGVTKLPLM